MKAIGVIPVRFAATRFEGKVLADLLGKPVLQHVWERAKQSQLLEDLIIACDDERILKEATAFGAKALLTSKDHPSGSDRVIEVVKDIDVQIVVNIQGDEPLMHHSIIDDLVRALLDDNTCAVSTAITPIKNEQELNDPNLVKCVIDQNNYALYFSRSPIPYNRAKKNLKEVDYYKHLGIYAFQKSFLMKFKDLPKSDLEKTEQLEQLRILQAGYKIKTVQTEHVTVSVDTPKDLKKAEELLRKEMTVG